MFSSEFDMQLTWCHWIKSERTYVQLIDDKDNDGVHQCLIWHPCDSNLIKFHILGFICWFLAHPRSCCNPAPFSSGQFRRRCVQLSDSSSHPRPFLPCLPASQLALRPGPRCRSSTDYPWWCATPPRLGNGQNAYWPTLLSQVRFGMIFKLQRCRLLEMFYSD